MACCNIKTDIETKTRTEVVYYTEETFKGVTLELTPEESLALYLILCNVGGCPRGPRGFAEAMLESLKAVFGAPLPTGTGNFFEANLKAQYFDDKKMPQFMALVKDMKSRFSKTL